MNQTQTATINDAARSSAREFTRAEVVTFILALIVGVIVLSVFVFSNQSLRLDESQSLWQASHSPMAMVKIVAEDVHVPLYHILLHYWQTVIGNDVGKARILSLIFFTLLIPAMYMLGKKAFDQSVGLYAALLAAISPFLNWYGNEIRMYSLFALLTVINQYFFVRIFSDEQRSATGRVSGWVWVGYAATLILGMFTHYFFLFNAITQAIFFLMYRNKFPRNSARKFVIVMLVILAIFTPWLHFVINMGAAGNTQPLLAQPSPADLFNTFSEFIFGFQNDHINTILISLWPLLVLLGFLSIRKNQNATPQAIYFFMSLILPIALVYAISSELKPIYLTRYLILSLPPLYLLLGWIFSTYPQWLSRSFKAALVVIMSVMLVIEIANADSPVKEDYRGASAYLSQQAAPQDIIVLSAPFTIYPFEYYYDGTAQVETLPIWDRYKAGPIPAFGEEQLQNDVRTLVDAHQRIWLLLSYDQGYEEAVRLYFDTHFERVDARNFSPGLNLYAYKLRYDDQSFDKVMRDIDTANQNAP